MTEKPCPRRYSEESSAWRSAHSARNATHRTLIYSTFDGSVLDLVNSSKACSFVYWCKHSFTVGSDPHKQSSSVRSGACENMAALQPCALKVWKLTGVILRAAEEHDAEAVRLGALGECPQVLVAILARDVVKLLAQVILRLHGEAHHALRLGRHRVRSLCAFEPASSVSLSHVVVVPIN